MRRRTSGEDAAAVSVRRQRRRICLAEVAAGQEVVTARCRLDVSSCSDVVQVKCEGHCAIVASNQADSGVNDQVRHGQWHLCKTTVTVQ